MPFWDHDPFTGVASHVTDPYKPFEVEVKHITAETINLASRKGNALVITDLVVSNVSFISCLHIDAVKEIRFSRRTTHDNSQALVLEFSNPSVVNEVMAYGLKVHSNLEPAQIHSQATDKPTLSAQQLRNRNLATENNLGLNKPAKRGLPSTTKCYQPAQEPRVKKRRKLTSKELEKRRGISENPVPL